MKELTIAGVVVMYLILTAFQHVLNWGYRQKNEDFPFVLVLLGQVFSLILFFGLTIKVAEIF